MISFFYRKHCFQQIISSNMSHLLPSYGTIFCSKIRSSTHIPNVFGREVISILKDVKNYDISYHSLKGEEREIERDS